MADFFYFDFLDLLGEMGYYRDSKIKNIWGRELRHRGEKEKE